MQLKEKEVLYISELLNNAPMINQAARTVLAMIHNVTITEGEIEALRQQFLIEVDKIKE